jgi:hypothetical protein
VNKAKVASESGVQLFIREAGQGSQLELMCGQVQR